MGALALTRDGKRGFKLYVGGGLGPVPYQAKVFAEFVPSKTVPTGVSPCLP
jgi:sulfite reductase beta subunit-like hemoprotein